MSNVVDHGSTTPDESARASLRIVGDLATRYIRNDWLFSRIMGTGKFPILRFSVILLAWYPALFVVCYFDNTLFLSPTTGGPPFGFCEDLFLITLLCAYIWGASALYRLFQKFDEFLAQFPDMLKPKVYESEEEKSKLIRSLEGLRDGIGLHNVRARRLYWCLWSVWILMLVIFQVILPVCNKLNVGWTLFPREHPLSFFVGIVWGLFYCSVVANATYYVLAIGIAIFPLVKSYADQDQLWIVPNAPDNQGGLSPIGVVALGMTLVFGGGMLPVAVWIHACGFDSAGILGCAAYSVFVSVVFFWPLWSTHDAMRRAKQVELGRVALLFRREYQSLPPPEKLTDGRPMRPEDEEKLRARLEMMAKLEHLHEAVKSMPVWPFDTMSLRKYLFLVGAPLLSGLVTKIWPAASKIAERVAENLSK